MKVWRNAEGREFPVYSRNDIEWARVVTEILDRETMQALGYELVQKEPVSFEAVVLNDGGCRVISDSRLRTGKKYKVTEVVE